MQERTQLLEVLAGECVCEGTAKQGSLAGVASCSTGWGRLAMLPLRAGGASS